jgi:hypothetical protein
MTSWPTDGTAMADLELAANMGTFLSDEVQAFLACPFPERVFPAAKSSADMPRPAINAFVSSALMVSRNVSRRKKSLHEALAAQGSNYLPLISMADPRRWPASS